MLTTNVITIPTRSAKRWSVPTALGQRCLAAIAGQLAVRPSDLANGLRAAAAAASGSVLDTGIAFYDGVTAVDGWKFDTSVAKEFEIKDPTGRAAASITIGAGSGATVTPGTNYPGRIRVTDPGGEVVVDTAIGGQDSRPVQLDFGASPNGYKVWLRFPGLPAVAADPFVNVTFGGLLLGSVAGAGMVSDDIYGMLHGDGPSRRVS